MQKTEHTLPQMLRSVLMGGVLAGALSLLLAMLFALLISMEALPEGVEGILAIAAAAVSVFTGAFAAVRAAGKRRLSVAVGAAAVYLLLTLLIRLLCFDGAWRIGPAAAAVMGALAAGLLGSRKKRRKR